MAFSFLYRNSEYTAHMNISIITQTPDYAVINKPAGISVHASGQREEYTIADWVLENFPQTKDVGEPLKISDGTLIARHGIVHRLDKDTSGALLIALTQDGYEFFKALFKNRNLKKTYHAFLHGNLKEDHLTIQEPIGRHKKDFRKRTTAHNSRGELKPAITFFKVLNRAKEGNEAFVFVEAQPKTGRTHQIRVHARFMHHPVIGDTLYARFKPMLLGFERLALHAYSLEFKDKAGFTIKIEAPYPTDFEHALEILGNSQI
jgi:23S rRNA pseudouridine1911/1915/1917 synthase